MLHYNFADILWVVFLVAAYFLIKAFKKPAASETSNTPAAEENPNDEPLDEEGWTYSELEEYCREVYFTLAEAWRSGEDYPLPQYLSPRMLAKWQDELRNQFYLFDKELLNNGCFVDCKITLFDENSFRVRIEVFSAEGETAIPEEERLWFFTKSGETWLLEDVQDGKNADQLP